MEFDPASDGTAILTLSAALNPQPPLLRDEGGAGSDDNKLANVGNVQLERYELKKVPAFQVRIGQREKREMEARGMREDEGGNEDEGDNNVGVFFISLIYYISIF
jgi:hypothetical protein